MRIDAQPGTSTGKVPGWYRDKNTQPGTSKNAVQEDINTHSAYVNHIEVPGYTDMGVPHMHAPARPHVTTLKQPGQPGTSPENTEQHTNQPGTSNPVPDFQPGTGARLLSWINYAFQINRSNLDIHFHLKNYPALLSHCRALTNATSEGEDVDTLWTYVAPIQDQLRRINAGTAPKQHSEKPTVGNARDRLNRNKAAPRNTAPTRTTKERDTMRATAASAEPKKPARRTPPIDADTLIDQMSQECERLEAAGIDPDHLAFIAHAMTCLCPAMHWVGGDPTTIQFPVAFQEERLAKTCAWLRALATAPAEQVEAARTQMLTALWQLWPVYAELCSDTPISDGNEYQERQWEFINRIDSLWVDPGWNGKEIAPYLPDFRDTECGRVSYSFHLTLLALVTLNRQTGRALLAFQAEAN